MKQVLYVINGCILILVISMLFALKNIQKEIKRLKDIEQTIEYIDKRMDTLEFYRIPGEDKHVHR